MVSYPESIKSCFLLAGSELVSPQSFCIVIIHNNATPQHQKSPASHVANILVSLSRIYGSGSELSLSFRVQERWQRG